MSKNAKLENKNRPDKLKMPIIFISIFLILIFILIANISGAVIDCSMCHKTVPGKVTIKAADTIEISNKTCLKCHDPNYPPTPIGYNTHLAHVGKYSAKVDYIKSHPSVASLNCDNCHINIGQNCQNCHIKNIPHIQPPLGNSCKGCHGELDKLFRHPTINLKIHDLFNVNDRTACAMCHNPDNMASLKLASGDTVPIQEPHKLCFQCHSNYYNLWNSGQHYSNKTVTTVDITTFDDELPTGRSSQVRAGLEDKWRKDNTCTNCHNPHNPSELYQLPIKELGNTSIDVTTLILYAILLIVIVAIFIIFVIKKKKFSFSELRLRLSRLKLSELKFAKLKKLKLPKISLPISISVEGAESGSEQVKEVEKVDIEKIDIEKETVVEETVVEEAVKAEKEKEEKGEQGLIEKTEIKDVGPMDTVPKVDKKAEKKNLLHKYRKDIYFILAICVMLGSFYVIFGAFIPITVVVSESMSPHIEKGDLIFYTDISRVDKIIMYNDGKKYQSFDNYGDVILYRPFGQEDVTPYIHRAMYYVSQDDEMWPGGPKAPHDGYITKGDNDLTNPKYDQQGSISLNEPIKKEWIVGVARFRIPYIGYIRLLLP